MPPCLYQNNPIPTYLRSNIEFITLGDEDIEEAKVAKAATNQKSNEKRSKGPRKAKSGSRKSTREVCSQDATRKRTRNSMGAKTKPLVMSQTTKRSKPLTPRKL